MEAQQYNLRAGTSSAAAAPAHQGVAPGWLDGSQGGPAAAPQQPVAGPDPRAQQGPGYTTPGAAATWAAGAQQASGGDAGAEAWLRQREGELLAYWGTTDDLGAEEVERRRQFARYFARQAYEAEVVQQGAPAPQAAGEPAPQAAYAAAGAVTGAATSATGSAPAGGASAQASAAPKARTLSEGLEALRSLPDDPQRNARETFLPPPGLPLVQDKKEGGSRKREREREHSKGHGKEREERKRTGKRREKRARKHGTKELEGDHRFRKFESEMATVVRRHLRQYLEKGAIKNKEDFKYLCKKFVRKCIRKERGNTEMRRGTAKHVARYIDAHFQKYPVFERGAQGPGEDEDEDNGEREGEGEGEGAGGHEDGAGPAGGEGTA